MKKLVSAVLSMAFCLTPMTAALMNTTAAGGENTSVFTEGSYTGEMNKISAEKPAFAAEKFFVVVGTFGGNTQLKYLYPEDGGRYGAEKIVLSKDYEEYSYGDVLVADGDIEMTRVQSAPGDPIYMMAYHYMLSDESVLRKVGTCDELMEKKKLTVTSNNYDGSAHWSIHLADEDGNEYYYGFNTSGSSLGVNPNGEPGDTYIYALNDGKIVIPLEKLESAETSATTDISVEDTDENPAFAAEKFFVVVGTFGGNTQLKYLYPGDDGRYDAYKIVLSKDYEDYSYGDVLVADGDIEMTRVQSAPDDRIYMMAYHYVLSDESVLSKVGTCDELMEKKKLTVTSNNYDGSAHWSIHLTDEDGKAYYYGFNSFGSSLGVNPNGEPGDTYIYALNDGKIVVPLEKLESAETSTTTTSDTTTAVTAAPKHIASDETLLQWAVNDYQEKTDAQNVAAKIVPSADDNYVINIVDENGNVLDTYVIDPATGMGTNSDDETVDLPQTGMSGAHKVIAGMAALMALTGAVLIKKSKKDDEE